MKAGIFLPFFYENILEEINITLHFFLQIQTCEAKAIRVAVQQVLQYAHAAGGLSHTVLFPCRSELYARSAPLPSSLNGSAQCCHLPTNARQLLAQGGL